MNYKQILAKDLEKRLGRKPTEEEIKAEIRGCSIRGVQELNEKARISSGFNPFNRFAKRVNN